jgi:hypothetical protein
MLDWSAEACEAEYGYGFNRSVFSDFVRRLVSQTEKSKKTKKYRKRTKNPKKDQNTNHRTTNLNKRTHTEHKTSIHK